MQPSDTRAEAEGRAAPEAYTFWLCDCSDGWPRHCVSELRCTVSAQGLTIHGSEGFTVPWVQVLDCTAAVTGAYRTLIVYAKLTVVGRREPLCLTPIDALRPRTPGNNGGEADDLVTVITAMRAGTPVTLDRNPYLRALQRRGRPLPAEMPDANVEPWTYPIPEPVESPARRKFLLAMLGVAVLGLIGIVVAATLNNIGLMLAIVIGMIAVFLWAPAYFNSRSQ